MSDLKIENYVGKQLLEDLQMIAETDIDWSKLKNKTVLITGANGFIAYYMIMAMLLKNDREQAGIRICGMVRSLKKAEKKYGELAGRPDLCLVEADVCDGLERCPHADYVIHAASQATPYYFENDPVGTIEANTIGTTNVLRYAAKEKVQAVLMVSSLKVYGDLTNGRADIREEEQGYLDIDAYKNCYAVGKRTAETLCVCYAKQFGVPVKIARPSYIYGASTLEDDRVWAQFLANIIRKESILLKSNGAAYRSFCYVTDTARALLAIMLNGEVGVPYNIAARHSDITIRDFAKTAVAVFPERGMSLSFANPEDEAEPVLDVSRKTPEILASDRLEKLGWQALVDVKEGIRRAVLTMEERA
jgi:nucleoside-diphosphate-sugar epimerase